MNKAILIGRLTRDPDTRQTQSGIAVTTFTLAIDRPYKDENGIKETDFLNIVVWRTQAENCAKYLSKGKMCAVVGSVQTRSYEKDGEKKYVTEIVADNVEFLSPKEAESETKPKQTTLDDLKPLEDDSNLPF